MATRRDKTWREFQEEVAALFNGIDGCTALVDQSVSCRFGTVQIDVLATFQAAPMGDRGHGLEFPVVVECKFWKRKIPREKILVLKAIVDELGAGKGFLVTDVGVQKGVADVVEACPNLEAVTFKELKERLRGPSDMFDYTGLDDPC